MWLESWDPRRRVRLEHMAISMMTYVSLATCGTRFGHSQLTRHRDGDVIVTHTPHGTWLIDTSLWLICCNGKWRTPHIHYYSHGCELYCSEHHSDNRNVSGSPNPTCWTIDGLLGWTERLRFYLVSTRCQRSDLEMNWSTGLVRRHSCVYWMRARDYRLVDKMSRPDWAEWGVSTL